jgi:hypothetical protein
MGSAAVIVYSAHVPLLVVVVVPEAAAPTLDIMVDPEAEGPHGPPGRPSAAAVLRARGTTAGTVDIPVARTELAAAAAKTRWASLATPTALDMVVTEELDITTAPSSAPQSARVDGSAVGAAPPVIVAVGVVVPEEVVRDHVVVPQTRRQPALPTPAVVAAAGSGFF